MDPIILLRFAIIFFFIFDKLFENDFFKKTLQSETLFRILMFFFSDLRKYYLGLPLISVRNW